MTNEILLESGEIQMLNLDINKDFDILRQVMGYCPQSNAIFEFLTVEETFRYYSKIKFNSYLNYKTLLYDFGLGQFKNTIARNLSGGNKRKLNFAISLMNKPNIILLDEPSTGVDPESRRVMWKHINDIPKHVKNFNMVLSTHSLEEAEILCDTVGWMKNGNFICIGNPDKLKFQFSEVIVQSKFRDMLFK
jgi:ABC-type multidrug transport system ATPase subunit